MQTAEAPVNAAVRTIVDIQQLRKSYGSNEVLKGIDLQVKAGEVIAIIGKSGSGKSTLLRCINGLEVFQSGSLSVDGQPLLHGNAAANLAVQQCDLLLAVGARFDDRVTGKLDTFAPDAKVIHLDIDPAELGKLRRPHVAIAGDIDAALRALAQPLQLAAWQQQVAALIAEHRWRYDYPGADIYAPRLLRELSAALPEDAIISCDVGQHQMWVAQHMRFASPRCHLTSGGLGTMGFGLPAAIGAQFANPQRTVVNVTGDGSFMMNVQELATIRRYQLPVKIVLLDNQRLGMVRQWQQLFFDGRFSETILDDNPDFLMLAAACGIPGRSIRQGDEVAAALAELAAAPGPFILHVAIDADANVWPLVPPGKANHELIATADA